MKLYTLPSFLEGVVSEDTYLRWLQRKAFTHAKRDRLRGYKNISVALYKKQIHDAILKSEGKDAYTGEKLDWHLLSKFRGKKKGFGMLPTVDHVHKKDGKGFKICSWIVNDLKNDLSEKELHEVIKKISLYFKKR